MNPEQNPSSNVARIIVIVAIILIAGGAAAYAVLGKKSTGAGITSTASTATTPASTSTTPSASTTAASAGTQTYKNGTYSAVGSYLSPGGNEKIGVQLTLQDDVVTAASVTPEPVSSEGRMYQEKFANGFQALVVGKNISAISLSEVSGSSLTSQGFNDAVQQIEAEAKA